MELPAILVFSGKGGVGKSTVAAALAVRLGRDGVRIGVLDADLAGPSMPLLLRHTDPPNVVDGRMVPPLAMGVKFISAGLFGDSTKAFVWTGALLEGVLDQFVSNVNWRGTEVLIVDMPPGAGELHMSLIKKLQPVGAILVSTPHPLAVADNRRTLGFLEEGDIPVLAVVENMAYVTCRSCLTKSRLFGGEATECLASGESMHFSIPVDPALGDMSTMLSNGSAGEDPDPAASIIDSLVKVALRAVRGSESKEKAVQ